jgi:hypothetical protein
MGPAILKREFTVGDLVTIAPEFREFRSEFRHGTTKFNFEKYMGIVVENPEDGEYVVYWTQAPIRSPYRGVWSGDHLVRVEDYEAHKKALQLPRQ